MIGKYWISILHIAFLLFFSFLFLVEVSTYSLLPPDEGGMSYWTSFKEVWWQSVWFYAILLVFVSLNYFLIRRK